MFSGIMLAMCLEYRWFYCEPGRYWEPFCGCDSMTLEEAHSKLVSDFRTFGKEDGVIEVSVLGDMYEVEVKLKESSITPIYWEGSALP